MQTKRVDGGFLVRLHRGEELISSLAELMRQQEIGCGAVTGLGAVAEARLGFYQLSTKSYLERRMEGEFEAVGLTGTLSWHDGEPFPHVHLLLTDADFQATGGHCFEAIASATLELYVRAHDERVERRVEEDIGLHLMQLEG